MTPPEEMVCIDELSERDLKRLFRHETKPRLVVFKGRTVKAQVNQGTGDLEVDVSEGTIVADWRRLSTLRDAVKNEVAALVDDPPIPPPQAVLIGSQRYDARVKKLHVDEQDVRENASIEVFAPSGEWIPLREMYRREAAAFGNYDGGSTEDVIYDLKNKPHILLDGCHIVRVKGLPCRARIVGPNGDQLAIEYGVPRHFRSPEVIFVDLEARQRDRDQKVADALRTIIGVRDAPEQITDRKLGEIQGKFLKQHLVSFTDLKEDDADDFFHTISERDAVGVGNDYDVQLAHGEHETIFDFARGMVALLQALALNRNPAACDHFPTRDCLSPHIFDFECHTTLERAKGLFDSLSYGRIPLDEIVMTADHELPVGIVNLHFKMEISVYEDRGDDDGEMKYSAYLDRVEIIIDEARLSTCHRRMI